MTGEEKKQFMRLSKFSPEVQEELLQHAVDHAQKTVPEGNLVTIEWARKQMMEALCM